MRKSVVANLFGPLVLAICAGAPLISAVAHEGHQIECDETSINAMTADIQAMSDGEAKTTAMKEMQMAEDMMESAEACKTHLHNATEAIEK